MSSGWLRSYREDRPSSWLSVLPLARTMKKAFGAVSLVLVAPPREHRERQKCMGSSLAWGTVTLDMEGRDLWHRCYGTNLTEETVLTGHGDGEPLRI